jgi:TatD DNase family protein
MIELFDTHAHLETESLFGSLPDVLRRARDAGLTRIITVGTDLTDARRAVEIAREYAWVHAAVGIHPHHAKDANDRRLQATAALGAAPEVVAFGEIGLDFFRNHSPHDTQRRVFADQLTIAKSLNKPVIIHLRDAYREGLDIIERASPFSSGGVIHCFSGDASDANRALDLGFHISIPGTITYKNNGKLRQILRDLPPDRIVIETDSPYLSPEPKRGKTNEPAHIVYTADRVADVLGLSFETAARLTYHNACKLFNIPVEPGCAGQAP